VKKLAIDMETVMPAPDGVSFMSAVFALFLLGGFFSLFDCALAESSKPRLTSDVNKGVKKFARLLAAAEDPQIYHAAAGFWLCLSRILAGMLAAVSMTRIDAVLPAQIFYAALLIISAFIMSELIPRAIARSAPERIAAALLPLFKFFVLPLRPFAFLASRAGGFFRAAFRIEARLSGMTEDELRMALAEGEKSGIVERAERNMVEGVFYLGDRPVGAFMTHRSEVQWLDINAPPDEIRAKALQFRAQRCFPVADGALDAIMGAVYLEDIILDHASSSPRGLRAIMKKAQFVPETMTALKAFESFKRGEANFLFVMDEYGGFAGVISILDLIEEIVGGLSATRRGSDSMRLQDDGAWLASGSANIDEAARVLSLPGLADDYGDYHTLAGFVLSLAGELPRAGQSFLWQGWRFTVMGMDGNRIDTVQVQKET
jgi:putative hemolysin